MGTPAAFVKRSFALCGFALCLCGCGEKIQPVSPKVEPAQAQAEAQAVPPAPGPRPGQNLIVKTPFAIDRDAGSGPAGKPLFMEIRAEDSKVDFVNAIDESHPLRRLYASAMACGGVAVGDVDGDGKPDLFFTNGPGKNRLFRQTGAFQFEDITGRAGVDGGDAWGVGTAMVDIDNDGDLDIYVCNHDSPNQFFLNDRSGVFQEAAAGRGLAVNDASHTPAFCDYDRDGDLDLFVLTNRFYHPDGKFPDDAPVLDVTPGNVRIKPEYEKYIRITGSVPGDQPGTQRFLWGDAGRPDYLLQNDGKGTFTDVTKRAGIESFGFGLSATWWDFNGDGNSDLYVGNDFDDPDYFYRNNGDGTFTNIIRNSVPHTTWFSMGADFGDLDEDGLPDFLIADMSGTSHYKQKTAMGAMSDKAEFLATAEPRQYMRNALYLNTGTERFREAAYLAGLAGTDWTWTVKIADFDNDSRLDVFFTNGMSKNFNESDRNQALDIRPGETQWDRHVRAGTPALKEQNLAYRNLGELAFEDVSHQWGLDHVGMSFGAVHADLDRDGDLDLVVVNLEEPVSIYRNESTANRVTVSLAGSEDNRAGLGARITLTAGGKTQQREVTLVRGYLASHEARAHFGLGDAERIESLEVEWPGGHWQAFENLEANAHYQISEPSGKPAKRVTPVPAPPMFREFPVLALTRTERIPIQHVENPFNDFLLQPLLPNKMSQWGPALGVGDFDGDGDEDLVLGGSRDYPTQLGLNQGAGKYLIGRMSQDAHFEDAGILLFEADGDGDLDLYIASGGSEFPPGHAGLRHRLYLNNGKGNFFADPERIPDIRDSASCVVAGDYDRDGDLDLFVGGRFVPGAYPVTPRSHLLRNDGGKFSDVTAEAAPGLGDAGLVTGALFSDANGDGWVDMLVTHDWGAVKLFGNESGRLADMTAAAGLSSRLGWWTGITGGDFDRDGDMDYVVTNFGLNTKYHASAEKPSLLYYGDFEGDGKKQLVEAEFENDVLFPVRGRSCSSNAMPHLSKKFGTYQSFAVASLQDIYTPERLGTSLRLECDELRCGVLLNDGDGASPKFTFEPFPRIAQIAPAFGAVVTDADADGIPDIVLGQNFFGPQVETGRMDGGVGQLLIGRGDGKFDAVSPGRSGIIVPGDVTGVVSTDLNGDHRPDLVFARNNDSIAGFINQGGDTRFVTIELQGFKGNPEAVGARVTVTLSDGTSRVAEVHAGSGYLSQSSRKPVFGIPGGVAIERIEVRWPDGSAKAYTDGLNTATISLMP